MARGLTGNYAHITPADADYPLGGFKNDSTGAAGDGTPVDNGWLNDWWGFLQAILTAANVVPSGAPDTAQSSQYLTALRALMWSPGDVKFSFGATPDAGWLELDGKTVGSAASGSTGRANADTAALYAKLWALTALSIYDSAGAAAVRGASAAADFAANKRIALPDMRGAAPRGWDHGAGVDAGRAMGSLQLDALQNITGTMAVDDAMAATATGALAADGTGVGGYAQGTGLLQTVTFDASRVARTATETRMRNVAGMFVIKL